MRILAVDQARHGAWAVFNYEKKKLLKYGTFAFENQDCDFPHAIRKIETTIEKVINANRVQAVFYEDIQLRQNAQSFKKLAQLQGVLVNLAIRNDFPYGLVQPSQWQSYCGIRVRKSGGTITNKDSKTQSVQTLEELFHIKTDNDNLSDAILIGWYVVNNIRLNTPAKNKKK